ncbi:hypothetical protein MPC4_30213 [Methylocella tundrae]|uniref:Uncharacterized protein n=1 Tax=Methylocella tundrae TaxID=227605 RepID=A0A8B6M7M4_METTU|nr:hypothetical protein MPC1_4810003 [Methylocella tundrae]VTZ51029.1 hypothetical protein MPC4_30213 [Methylocella tundrae]
MKTANSGFPRHTPMDCNFAAEMRIPFNQFRKKCLCSARISLFLPLPIFARACGRVSVGGDPDKRPVNRLKRTDSRRRTGEPRQTGDAT